MTMEQVLDMIVSDWGMEDQWTIELFKMAEWGALPEDLAELHDMVNRCRAEDWFGFEP